MILVFEGSIASWGKRGFAIYIPRHLEGYASQLHGKRVLVIVIPLEMHELLKPLEELRKEIDALRREVEELRKRIEGGQR